MLVFLSSLLSGNIEKISRYWTLTYIYVFVDVFVEMGLML